MNATTSLKGFATVLSRPTGHYLVDGQTGRTLIYSSLGNPLMVYKLAAQRGLKLVSEESLKGRLIFDRSNSERTHL